MADSKVKKIESVITGLKLAAEDCRQLMLEYANAPLSQRANGWEWLYRARQKIEKEIEELKKSRS